MNIQLYIDFFLRIAPAMMIGICFIALLPRKNLETRILSYIMVFILFRDTMTPLKFWVLGDDNFFWIRFREDPFLIMMLGFLSLISVGVIYFYEKGLRGYIIWLKGGVLRGVTAGLIGMFIIILPFIIAYSSIPVDSRGGEVHHAFLIPLLFMTLSGNLLEEFLFRGYLQGYFETFTGTNRAVLLSGLAFGFGHVFLATTVTDIGIPLLIFVIYEGTIAAFIRSRYGVLPSTLTHGLTIFILSSGLM